jgi:hypothetical protein
MARDTSGRFTAGNPGRPKGSGRAARLATAIARDMPDIIDALVTQAKDGNTQAAALLLARAYPLPKPTSAPIRLTFAPGASLSDKAHGIIDAVAAGSLAPDTGAQLIAALGKVVAIVEATELERRIEALEKGRYDHPLD